MILIGNYCETKGKCGKMNNKNMNNNKNNNINNNNNITNKNIY
jgi:hypothetical protein